MAGRERHRLAVLEIDVAQHPAGLRRPGQHAERRRVGDHQEVAAALHLRHAEAAAGGEHREHGLVRGVLGQQRGGDASSRCASPWRRRRPRWSCRAGCRAGRGTTAARPRGSCSSISRSARAAASNCSSLHRPWRSTKVLAAERSCDEDMRRSPVTHDDIRQIEERHARRAPSPPPQPSPASGRGSTPRPPTHFQHTITRMEFRSAPMLPLPHERKPTLRRPYRLTGRRVRP